MKFVAVIAALLSFALTAAAEDGTDSKPISVTTG